MQNAQQFLWGTLIDFCIFYSSILSLLARIRYVKLFSLTSNSNRSRIELSATIEYVEAHFFPRELVSVNIRNDSHIISC